jgi:hypothetical protein
MVLRSIHQRIPLIQVFIASTISQVTERPHPGVEPKPDPFGPDLYYIAYISSQVKSHCSLGARIAREKAFGTDQ